MSISVHIIDQMAWAQETFSFCMDKLNHDTEMSFEDKAAMVARYKSFFPLWPHNNRLLQDTLDRINPAYAGRSKWIICGEAFWVINGQWQECADETLLREDSYLHAATGTLYTIECALAPISAIKINGKIVWEGRGEYNKTILVERGVNWLLITLGILPF